MLNLVKLSDFLLFRNRSKRRKNKNRNLSTEQFHLSLNSHQLAQYLNLILDRSEQKRH